MSSPETRTTIVKTPTRVALRKIRFMKFYHLYNDCKFRKEVLYIFYGEEKNDKFRSTWRAGWIVVLAAVRRIGPWTVRLVLDRGAGALGMRAGLVGRHWPRRVHQYMAHMRHVGPVRVGRRVDARRFRERFQSLDQLRLRARYRQVSTFQLHFEIAYCKDNV